MRNKNNVSRRNFLQATGSLSGALGNIPGTLDLADINEWGAMNEVYTTFFPNKPARSALGVSGVALNARVEIECIAVIR